MDLVHSHGTPVTSLVATRAASRVCTLPKHLYSMPGGGVSEQQLIVLHSSLQSFGYVDAEAVFDT